jgi:hypothetical protein
MPAVPRSGQTQTNTYERKGAVDAPAVDIQKAVVHTSIADTAAGNNPLTRPVEVEPFADNDRFEQEKFMREPVEIHVHEAPDENAPQFVEVTVNGDYRLLHRGATAIVPRSHVGVLCDAKEGRLEQQKVTNNDGSMGYKERVVTKLTYPFSVIHDPSGAKGAAWLRQKLNSPA